MSVTARQFLQQASMMFLHDMFQYLALISLVVQYTSLPCASALSLASKPRSSPAVVSYTDCVQHLTLKDCKAIPRNIDVRLLSPNVALNNFKTKPITIITDTNLPPGCFIRELRSSSIHWSFMPAEVVYNTHPNSQWWQTNTPSTYRYTQLCIRIKQPPLPKLPRIISTTMGISRMNAPPQAGVYRHLTQIECATKVYGGPWATEFTCDGYSQAGSCFADTGAQFYKTSSSNWMNNPEMPHGCYTLGEYPPLRLQFNANTKMLDSTAGLKMFLYQVKPANTLGDFISDVPLTKTQRQQQYYFTTTGTCATNAAATPTWPYATAITTKAQCDAIVAHIYTIAKKTGQFGNDGQKITQRSSKDMTLVGDGGVIAFDNTFHATSGWIETYKSTKNDKVGCKRPSLCRLTYGKWPVGCIYDSKEFVWHWIPPSLVNTGNTGSCGKRHMCLCKTPVSNAATAAGGRRLLSNHDGGGGVRDTESAEVPAAMTMDQTETASGAPTAPFSLVNTAAVNPLKKKGTAVTGQERLRMAQNHAKKRLCAKKAQDRKAFAPPAPSYSEIVDVFPREHPRGIWEDVWQSGPANSNTIAWASVPGEYERIYRFKTFASDITVVVLFQSLDFGTSDARILVRSKDYAASEADATTHFDSDDASNRINRFKVLNQPTNASDTAAVVMDSQPIKILIPRGNTSESHHDVSIEWTVKQAQQSEQPRDGARLRMFAVPADIVTETTPLDIHIPFETQKRAMTWFDPRAMYIGCTDYKLHKLVGDQNSTVSISSEYYVPSDPAFCPDAFAKGQAYSDGEEGQQEGGEEDDDGEEGGGYARRSVEQKPPSKKRMVDGIKSKLQKTFAKRRASQRALLSAQVNETDALKVLAQEEEDKLNALCNYATSEDQCVRNNRQLTTLSCEWHNNSACVTSEQLYCKDDYMDDYEGYIECMFLSLQAEKIYAGIYATEDVLFSQEPIRENFAASSTGTQSFKNSLANWENALEDVGNVEALVGEVLYPDTTPSASLMDPNAADALPIRGTSVLPSVAYAKSTEYWNSTINTSPTNQSLIDMNSLKRHYELLSAWVTDTLCESCGSVSTASSDTSDAMDLKASAKDAKAFAAHVTKCAIDSTDLDGDSDAPVILGLGPPMSQMMSVFKGEGNYCGNYAPLANTASQSSLSGRRLLNTGSSSSSHSTDTAAFVLTIKRAKDVCPKSTTLATNTNYSVITPRCWDAYETYHYFEHNDTIPATHFCSRFKFSSFTTNHVNAAYCKNGMPILKNVSAAENNIICNDKYTFKHGKNGEILYYEEACLAAKRVTKTVGLDYAKLQQQLQVTAPDEACTMLNNAKASIGCAETQTNVTNKLCVELKTEYQSRGCCA